MASPLLLKSPCPCVGLKDVASPVLARPGPTAHALQRRRQAVIVRAAAAVVETSDTARLPRWEYIFDQLTEKGVKTIRPAEAENLLKKGYVLVDVRPKHIYEKAHPVGAKNAALFRKFDVMNKPSFTGILRATALALNGVEAVEPNPEFVQELKAAAAGSKKVIVACEAGGTLAPSASFQYGKESRSLKAAYKALTSNQFTEVLHLGGGVYGWFKAGLPFEGEYDTGNVGRTPNAVPDSDT